MPREVSSRTGRTGCWGERWRGGKNPTWVREAKSWQIEPCWFTLGLTDVLVLSHHTIPDLHELIICHQKATLAVLWPRCQVSHWLYTQQLVKQLLSLAQFERSFCPVQKFIRRGNGASRWSLSCPEILCNVTPPRKRPVFAGWQFQFFWSEDNHNSLRSLDLDGLSPNSDLTSEELGNLQNWISSLFLSFLIPEMGMMICMSQIYYEDKIR